MLWNAGAVAATGLLILLAVRLFVPPMLIDDLDQVLGEDLKEINLHFPVSRNYDWSAITEELSRKAEGHELHRWFVQFYDEAGQPMWSSLNAPTLPQLTDDQRKKPFSLDNYRISYSRLDHPPKE